MKLIVLEYLLCARHFAECFPQIITFFKQPYEVGVLFFPMFLNFI